MTAQPWETITTHYQDLNDHGWKLEVLSELIEHIKTVGLSKRLFVTTSLDKILISCNKEIEFQKEILHISFDREKQQWHFKYYAVPCKDPEFSRIYPVEKGIEKLDKFIKMIRW